MVSKLVSDRRKSSATLFAKVVEAREVAQGLLGGKSTEALGLDETAPHDPAQLAQHIKSLAGKFRVAKLPKLRVKGAYTLAGEKELASRVRPSTRRPGRTVAEEPGDPAEPAEPNDGRAPTPGTPSPT